MGYRGYGLQGSRLYDVSDSCFTLHLTILVNALKASNEPPNLSMDYDDLTPTDEKGNRIRSYWLEALKYRIAALGAKLCARGVTQCCIDPSDGFL